MILITFHFDFITPTVCASECFLHRFFKRVLKMRLEESFVEHTIVVVVLSYFLESIEFLRFSSTVFLLVGTYIIVIISNIETT